MSYQHCESCRSGRLALKAVHTIPRELRATVAYQFDASAFATVKIPVLLLRGRRHGLVGVTDSSTGRYDFQTPAQSSWLDNNTSRWIRARRSSYRQCLSFWTCRTDPAVGSRLKSVRLVNP